VLQKRHVLDGLELELDYAQGRGRRDPEERDAIFVSGIDENTGITYDQFRSYFQGFGTLVRCFLKAESRYGFVTYKDDETNDYVLSMDHTIENCRVGVSPAQGHRDKLAKRVGRSRSVGGSPERGEPEDKIWVGGIPTNADYQQFRNHFVEFGELERCFLKKGRGFGFLTYADDEVNANVLQMTHKFQGEVLEVRPAGQAQENLSREPQRDRYRSESRGPRRRSASEQSDASNFEKPTAEDEATKEDASKPTSGTDKDKNDVSNETNNTSTTEKSKSKIGDAQIAPGNANENKDSPEEKDEPKAYMDNTGGWVDLNLKEEAEKATAIEEQRQRDEELAVKEKEKEVQASQPPQDDEYADVSQIAKTYVQTTPKQSPYRRTAVRNRSKYVNKHGRYQPYMKRRPVVRRSDRKIEDKTADDLFDSIMNQHMSIINRRKKRSAKVIAGQIEDDQAEGWT